MIRFGSFQVDPRTWLLTSDGRAVDLSPRLVEILAFIVSRAGEIVTKEELLEKFWPEVNVTENTLTRAIADIRKAIGEDAASPRFLQTVSRRGYKFGVEAASITPATDPFQDWVKGRLATVYQCSDELARRRRLGQPGMGMTEGMQDISRAGREADARQGVRRLRSLARCRFLSNVPA